MKTPFKSLEFIYQDTEIHFLFSQDENIMVNATDMAKLFNKYVKDFMRLETTNNFIKSFLKSKNSNREDSPYLIEQVYLSKPKTGTVMIRPLALKFAAWLDSDFEVWVFDKLDDILFGNYNIHRKKSIEIEKTKKNIEALESKIIQKQDNDAIELLKNQKLLKQLQKDKTKAIIDQTKVIQLDLF